jgi:FdrA protein
VASPLAAINVGVETVCDSLLAQGISSLQVDWRPPAGGDERLAGILRRMKARSKE